MGDDQGVKQLSESELLGWYDRLRSQERELRRSLDGVQTTLSGIEQMLGYRPSSEEGRDLGGGAETGQNTTEHPFQVDSAPGSAPGLERQRDSDAPKSREGVLRVMQDDPTRWWEPGEVLQELERRGWGPRQRRGSKSDPKNAVSTLLRRMANENELERRQLDGRRGAYRPATARQHTFSELGESPDAGSNGDAAP